MNGKIVATATTCTVCGDVGQVWAVAEVREKPSLRRLWAFCERDPSGRLGHRLRRPFLDCESYLTDFPELGASKSRRPSRQRISRGKRYSIVARDGYRCVFCRIRIEKHAHPGDVALDDPSVAVQVDAFEKSRAIPDLKGGDVRGELQVGELAERDSDRDLFAVEADHVYPCEWHADMAECIDKRDRQRVIGKCESDWIVSTCADCNGGRYWHPELPRTLLSLYARHLFGAAGTKPENGAYDDLKDFIVALRAYAHVRAVRATPLRNVVAG